MATAPQTHAGHARAPAGATGPTGHGIPAGFKYETAQTASPEVRMLIAQLNRLAAANTIEETNQALANFDEDMTFDTPFLQIQGRERVRMLSQLVKAFLGTFQLEPRLIKISVPEGAATRGGQVEVDGIVHWLPNRPWFLPLTLLLPRDIPIFADVSMGVKAHNDKVYFVSGKTHNLPHVPRILRILAGYVAGAAVSVVEPVYKSFLDWYNSQGGFTSEGMGYAGTGYSSGTTTSPLSSAVETVRNMAAPVVERVAEVVPGVERVAESMGLKVGAPGTTGGTTGGMTGHGTSVPSQPVM